jgi:hypothetical protein
MKAAGFDDKLSNSGASCCRCHFFVQRCIGFDENEKISNKQKKTAQIDERFFCGLFYCPALPPGSSARTNSLRKIQSRTFRVNSYLSVRSDQSAPLFYIVCVMKFARKSNAITYKGSATSLVRFMTIFKIG